MTASVDAVWFVSVERPGWRSEWDTDSLGPPDPLTLLPTRRPTSGDFSRHIPHRAYSVTTGGALELESGLEYDVMRWLDGRPDVVWLVAQPVRFHFLVPGKRRPLLHTPDLLSLQTDGTVTLWDARPAPRQDDAFVLKSELTAEECRKVGWRHEIFDGLPTPTRMNLLWLNGYRRPVPWHRRWIPELESLLRMRSRTVGELRGRDDGSGESIGTMWHLIATGRIACDQSVPIRDPSVLWWRDDLKPQDSEPLRPGASLDMTRSDVLVGTRLQRAQR